MGERDVPVREARDAVEQIPASLILWIHQDFDVHLGQLLRDAVTQVVREAIIRPKRRLTTLQPVSSCSYQSLRSMRGLKIGLVFGWVGIYLEAVDEY